MSLYPKRQLSAVDLRGQVSIGGVPVTADAGELNKLDGLTAETAELNKLDGVTAETSEINILDGVTKTAAEINLLVAGQAAGFKLARGQSVIAGAETLVNTGLTTVVAAVAVLDDDPGLDPLFVTCTIGDQAGAPAAGNIIIKAWKATAANDCTPIAATTFNKKVNWIAIGT